MKWEELTAPDFVRGEGDSRRLRRRRRLRREALRPPSARGRIFSTGTRFAALAAEKEAAVVFPPYYFGQIHEARCFPGTVALEPVLCLQVLLATFDEIARNGFRKIIVYNAHGGNTHLLNYACQATLAARKPYAVFLPDRLWPERRQKEYAALLTTKVHAHGCECETSISLANHEHLVKMKSLRGRKTEPLGRLNHIPPGRVTGRWYSDYPDHYAGDATAASKEKGEKLRSIIVDSLADYIRAVKNDKAALEAAEGVL